MTSQEKLLMERGQRAVDYYIDTGQCVFCNADDALHIPHAYVGDRDGSLAGCDVGKASGVVLTEERRQQKIQERGIVAALFMGAENNTPERE